MRKGPSDGRARAPFSGTITMHVLVLLVNFFDTPMDSGSTTAFYKNLLETGSGLTMTKYYQDMSQGHLNLEFTVEGPYTVGESLAYYGANDASGNEEHSGELVWDALLLFTAAKALTDPSYNYSDYDSDGDGFVDVVFVIHAGRGEESGASPDTIWSYQSRLTASGLAAITAPDGTKFNVYTVEPEYSLILGDSSIGIFCHEFGHVLGLPDLYDVKYETNGLGRWSLMSSGQWGSNKGVDPSPLLAWERYFVGGSAWIDLEELGSSARNVRINDIETSRKAYKISLNSPGQYLILEGKTGVLANTNPFVPGGGILITQIHESVISSRLYFNTVATGFNSVHGINVLEANTPHDEAGRGALWAKLPNYHPYMPFSSETRNYLRGSYNVGARGPLFPVGFPASAWPVCAAAVFFFFFGKARKKLSCRVFAAALALSAFLLTCSMSGLDGDYIPPGPHPNSNYYLSEDLYGKTGISGVTISNISSRASFPMTFDLELEE
jgi:M6 family metalloprotease-like protein